MSAKRQQRYDGLRKMWDWSKKVRLVYVWTVVTTDGLITLPIGKGRTGWLQHSSSFPVSQLLKCNVPAVCLRNFDRASYRTNH